MCDGLPREDDRDELLAIVADWVHEYYDTGGIGPDDLEWRLTQAGYTLPEPTTTEEN